MKNNNVKYGILLTKEQLDFLKDDHQGFHRMKAFDTFLSLAAIEPFRYEKKNFSADLDIGQFAISKVELAELWHCDRKTAQKMIDLFNEVGILTSVANNRTTIHTIHCISSWLVDGQQTPIRNPHYMRNPPYRLSKRDMKVSASVMLSVVPDEGNDNSPLYISRGAGGTGGGDNCKQNVVTSKPVKGEVPADQANATSSSSNENGISHPQSRIHIIPFHLWLIPTTMKGKKKDYLHTERMDSCQRTTWSNSTNIVQTFRQKPMNHMSLPITPLWAIVATYPTPQKVSMKKKARQIHLSHQLPIQ